jgi:hypothetical protein
VPGACSGLHLGDRPPSRVRDLKESDNLIPSGLAMRLSGLGPPRGRIIVKLWCCHPRHTRRPSSPVAAKCVGKKAKHANAFQTQLDKAEVRASRAALEKQLDCA